MNIVDKLTNRGSENPEQDREQKMRHDVLFTQIRLKTGLPSENIDLSGVDFSISDDDLRAQVAKARGLTSEAAAEQIDLDEIIIPSGKALRRALRTQQRAGERRRRKGQAAYHRQQRKARFAQGRPSNHAVVLLRRAAAEARAAQQEAGA